jgi:hypothetical protein
MALFGSNFATGFVKGLAESVDERLKDDMERTFDRVDRASDYHIRRRAEEEDRYNQELKEVENVLNELASFTNGDINKAAQLYKHGGGTVAGGQNLVQTLSTSRAELGSDFNTDTLVSYAENQTGGYSVGDYLDTFVNRPEEFAAAKLPEDARQGVGLYKFFKPDVSSQIEQQVREVFPEADRGEKPTIEVGTATIDYSKLPTAVEYKAKKEQLRLQTENALLRNRELEAQIEALGKMTGNDFESYFNDSLKSTMGQAGHEWNPLTGQFQLSTAKNAYETAYESHEYALEKSVQRAVETGAISLPDVRNAVYSSAVQSLPYYKGKFAVQPFDPETAEIGKIYAAEEDGILKTVVYLGPEDYLVIQENTP